MIVGHGAVAERQRGLGGRGRNAVRQVSWKGLEGLRPPGRSRATVQGARLLSTGRVLVGPGQAIMSYSFLEDSPPRAARDRRQKPTGPLDALRLKGRRARVRRREERHAAYFVDRFDVSTLALIVALLGLTLADGVLTLHLLDGYCEELNPFMVPLLARGPLAFLMGKYLLTAAGLPFVTVYKNYPLFGTRFRVGFLLPVFVGLYLALVSYQWALL
jgi:hypothetical protein